MGTDDFHNVSVVYGLDSQILANCFKAFAPYLDVPKKDWNNYHAPYKDNLVVFLLELLKFVLLIVFCLSFILKKHLSLLR
jgi:hypothetical protein